MCSGVLKSYSLKREALPSIREVFYFMMQHIWEKKKNSKMMDPHSSSRITLICLENKEVL